MTYYYTTPEKVRKFLGLSSSFSASTTVTLEYVENLIRSAEREIERRTGRAWRKKQSGLEYPPDKYIDQDGRYVVHLVHNDVVEITTLQNWDGSSWENWLTAKTEGKGDDYWVEYDNGKIHSNSFGSYDRGVQIQYYYGSPSTLLDGDHAADVTTITVDDTSNFPNEGIIRIEDEEIYYTGTTATELTGCSRGENDTTAATHADDKTVIPVYPEIDELCAKMVAYNLLYSDDRVAIYPEGNTQIRPETKKDALKADIDNTIYYLQSIVVK